MPLRTDDLTLLPNELRALADKLDLRASVAPVGIEGATPRFSRDTPAAKARRRTTAPHAPTPSTDNPPKPPSKIIANPPTGPPEDRPIWARPKVAAKLAGIGLTLLYQWINEGRVISRKIGGARLISVASLVNLTPDHPTAMRPGRPPGHRVSQVRR